jgi:hypothetical protein
MADNVPNDAGKALTFLRDSGLVDLNMPLEQLVTKASKLDQVAGYAVAWEKYAVVVASVADQVSNPIVNTPVA